MPSMHKDVYVHMERSLDRLRARMVNLLTFDLTHDECLELVALPEHINILRHAAKYADINAGNAYIGVRVPGPFLAADEQDVYITMRTHEGIDPPLRPRAPVWNANTVGAQKVREWTAKRLELGKRFGVASYALTTLYYACDNGAQVRYLWPVCMHLVNGAEPGTRPALWGEKFAPYTRQRHLPVISTPLKKAIQDSSALLTSAVLIGEQNVYRDPFGQVEIGLGNTSVADFYGVNIALV